MSVSAAGQQFIQNNEGGLQRTIYDASGNKHKGDWTIGYGHAVRGSEHKIYDKAVLTDDQAEAIFQSDLDVAQDAVRNSVQFSLTQNQFDALADFAFNIGSHGFSSSYTLSLLNSYSNFGDLIYAEGEWGFAFGNPSRRAAEVTLYNTPDGGGL